MKLDKLLRNGLTVIASAIAAFVALPLSAQQINGVPGRPARRMSLTGRLRVWAPDV